MHSCTLWTDNDVTGKDPLWYLQLLLGISPEKTPQISLGEMPPQKLQRTLGVYPCEIIDGKWVPIFYNELQTPLSFSKIWKYEMWNMQCLPPKLLIDLYYLSYCGMSNFAMGTILGKGFAQTQVHTEFIAQVPKARVLWAVRTSACGKPFPKIIVLMPKLNYNVITSCGRVVRDF